jgi:hypothetical protein
VHRDRKVSNPMLISQSIDRSARRRDLYLTTNNTHNRQTSMPPAGFETSISASQRPQTHALDHAVTGTGKRNLSLVHKNRLLKRHHAPNAMALFISATTSPSNSTVFIPVSKIKYQLQIAFRRSNFYHNCLMFE